MSENKTIKAETIKDKDKPADELSENLFRVLSKVLNEIHGTTFSQRFWKLMLANYVNASISLRPYLENEQFFRKPILQAINGWSPPSFKQIFKKELIRSVKYFLNRGNKGRYFSTLRSNDNILLGFPDTKAIKNDELGVKLPDYDLLYFGKGESHKRKRVREIALECDNTYITNVIRQLPKILVEHFKKTYDSIELYSPEKKTIHIHMGGSIYNTFMVAKYVEHGSTLYWYQHGSGLGEVEGFRGHSIHHELADQFRTWGWKLKEKDVPWKAYRLEEFKEKYCNFDNTDKADLLICFPNLSDRRREYYSNMTQKVLASLQEEKYKLIIGRPRRSNKIHSHKSELKFIEDNRVQLSTGLTPVMEEMSEARLVLQMNVPSTNFLECIYVDHPVVGLLGNKNPTTIIEPYYQFLLTEGVLHKDVDSLCTFLNRVDLDYWWENLLNKPMYQSFKHTFTRKG